MKASRRKAAERARAAWGKARVVSGGGRVDARCANVVSALIGEALDASAEALAACVAAQMCMSAGYADGLREALAQVVEAAERAMEAAARAGVQAGRSWT